MVLLAAAVMAMALTASSASASEVFAKFSTTSSFTVKGSNVTIKKAGGSAKTCSTTMSVSEFGPGYFTGLSGSTNVRFYCGLGGGGELYMYFNGYLKYDTVTGRYWLQLIDGPNSFGSPWGQYMQKTNQWTWVNGSGSTPSTITLNEQYIGYLASTGEKITLSGTLTATTTSGGLVTMTH